MMRVAQITGRDTFVLHFPVKIGDISRSFIQKDYKGTIKEFPNWECLLSLLGGGPNYCLVMVVVLIEG